MVDTHTTKLDAKFAALATDNAPGQEERRARDGFEALLRGGELPGLPVDFSHGDVDAFRPTPGSLELFVEGARPGSGQAYTEYRGSGVIRDLLAERLARFTGAPISAGEGVIITPGTQGALFLAVAASVAAGDKVAIVQPDYFANRKLAQFFDGVITPVRLQYSGVTDRAGLDLTQLGDAFRNGARTFLFSNPNNPTGVIYSPDEIREIAHLAAAHGAMVIVDQLYARQLFDGRDYTHLRQVAGSAGNVVTIMGPSKTESLSGYRLGVAIGPPQIITRMEKLQAIVSLRAPGYSQAVLKTWFAEPKGWMSERIALHQAIRDDLVGLLHSSPDVAVRTTEAGSYVFPQLPELGIPTQDFVRILRQQAGVTVTPGSEFGPDCLNSVRLNFSQDHVAAVAAVARMLELMERYR